jgi:hypothetical protein
MQSLLVFAFSSKQIPRLPCEYEALCQAEAVVMKTAAKKDGLKKPRPDLLRNSPGWRPGFSLR